MSPERGRIAVRTYGWGGDRLPINMALHLNRSAAQGPFDNRSDNG